MTNISILSLLQLAQEYSLSGQYMKAANLVLAAVKEVEADIPANYMPGDIPDDAVLSVFDFLGGMAREIPLEELEMVYKHTLEVFESRAENAYYEPQFEGLLEVMEGRLV